MAITPNQLTTARIFFSVLIPVILFENHSLVGVLVSVALFAVAGITDWWDGHIARTKSLITPLGQILDPVADKILILGCMIGFVHRGLYPFAWVALIFLRETVVTTTRLILVQRKKVIPAEQAGKVKFVVQIVSVGITFAYLLILVGFSRPEAHTLLLGLKFLNVAGILLANLITLYSGICFFTELFRKKA